MFSARGGFIDAASSGGASPIPTSPINVLWAANETSTNVNNGIARLAAVNTAIGWPSGTTFTGLAYTGDFTSNPYSSSYDVMIWNTDYAPGTNTYATINSFLAAGKGVIFTVFGHCYSVPYAYLTGGATATQISTTNNAYGSYNTACSLSGTTHPIGYQVTGVSANQGYAATTFDATNSASVLGTWTNKNMCIYKDNPVGTSRRVDVNYWPGGSWVSETSTTTAGRMLLNACYWAARKTN